MLCIRPICLICTSLFGTIILEFQRSMYLYDIMHYTSLFRVCKLSIYIKYQCIFYEIFPWGVNMIRYCTDVLAALKEAGYSSYRLRKEKIINESSIQQLRNGELVSWKIFNTICSLLECQPGELIEWVPDDTFYS